MPQDSGLAGINRNIDKIERNLAGAMKAGMDVGLLKAVNHIKTGYSRPATGKGFTDRTANLRNSIDKETERVSRHRVEGVTKADMDYAPYVETRNEGRFAFLWPGTNDQGDDILKSIAAAVSPLL